MVPDSSPPSLAKNASPRRFEAIRFGSELKSSVPVLPDPRFTQRQKQELAKLGLPLPCLFIRSQTLLTCCFISLLCISSFNQVPPSHTSGPSFYQVSPARKQPDWVSHEHLVFHGEPQGKQVEPKNEGPTLPLTYFFEHSTTGRPLSVAQWRGSPNLKGLLFAYPH